MLFGAGSVRKCRRLDGAVVTDRAAADIDLFDNFLLVKVEGRLRDVTLTGVPQVSMGSRSELYFGRRIGRPLARTLLFYVGTVRSR